MVSTLLKIDSTCNNPIRYYISMKLEQTVVHRKVLNSDDCVHQLCTFIFTPNSTQNAGAYRVVITASDASKNNITNSFNITSYLGNLVNSIS